MAVRMVSQQSYYADKLAALKDIFGAASIELTEHTVIVDDRHFPIVDDVIVCLDRSRWPSTLRRQIGEAAAPSSDPDFAADIQFTFGEEWKTFDTILKEHEETFRSYFDLIDLDRLQDQRLCDLGCGMGRWSYFASEYCREIVLVDFSEAIFVARRTLRDRTNAIFIMADVLQLPFRNDFADLIFSLGVLHHLPRPPLPEIVRLSRYAPKLLVYLYYALDNRPAYFRAILNVVSQIRTRLAAIRSARMRSALATLIALCIYRPLVGLGALLRPVGLSRFIPIYEGYRNQGLTAVRQDAYDRFFTRIEQRVSQVEIREALSGTFRNVEISPRLPYWHFVCER
jgi:SAM-dependent methyltransferase